MSALVARDGDILVVQYPEVTIPIAQYCTVKVGGLIYTRKLVAGEDAELQCRIVYEFLRNRAQADGRVKIDEYRAELRSVRGSA
jgi:hypothetical protein